MDTTSDDLLDCDRAALERVAATAHLPASGRERDDVGRHDVSHMLVSDRREHLRRLHALLGPNRLRALLRGFLTPFVRADLAVIEGDPSPRHFLRSSTSAAVLERAAQHRAARARELAARHVFDASDDNLRALLHVVPRPRRVAFLWDALLQFRALRRSSTMIDHVAGVRDTNAQGRLTTSGILAALETAHLAERAPGGREGALWRLVFVNAPHQAPNTIFRASHLTLELLGVNDRGPFGSAFLPVYHAVHTLYCADTPKIVEGFAKRVLGDDLARARRWIGRGELAPLRRATKLPLDDDALRDAVTKLLDLVDCVTTLAPSPASLLRDRGFALDGRVHVEKHVRACEAGDVVTAVAHANRARALLRASAARARGEDRLRAWRVDRALEHQCALLLADADRRDARALLPHAARAAQLTDALIAIGATGTTERALLRALDRLRAVADARARAIHFSGVRALLDPRFVDRLAKETPIHGLLALHQGVARRRTATSSGVPVRVLSRPGSTIFTPRFMREAPDPRALPNAAAIVLDARAAPPGYSHVVALTRERGIGLLVCDDVRAARKLPPPLTIAGGALVAAKTRQARAPKAASRPRSARVVDDDRIYTLFEFGALGVRERRRRAGEKAVVCAELLRALPERALDGVVIPYGLVARWLAMGKKLPRFLEDTGALRPFAQAGPLIVRSAFSCEDLPGHSAAGLFLSRGGVRGERALVRAVVDVIRSARDDSPRSVLIQKEQRARVSGVAVSRGLDGQYGAIGYQAVRGAGGGVRGGRVEEGYVSPVDHLITRVAPRRILGAAEARVLGATVMEIERLFFDVIEPRRGYAVDVEWLFAGRRLVIVQARVASV